MPLARSYAFPAGRPTPSLNFHFHFHVCVIDGVFSEDPEGSVLFHEATHLTAKDWDQAFRLIRLPPLLSPLGGRAAGANENVTVRIGNLSVTCARRSSYPVYSTTTRLTVSLTNEKTTTSERWGVDVLSNKDGVEAGCVGPCEGRLRPRPDEFLIRRIVPQRIHPVAGDVFVHIGLISVFLQ